MDSQLLSDYVQLWALIASCRFNANDTRDEEIDWSRNFLWAVLRVFCLQPAVIPYLNSFIQTRKYRGNAGSLGRGCRLLLQRRVQR